MRKKRTYCFAGVEIEISMPEEHFYTNEYRLAPSGTGKSTQAELGKQYRGEDIVNGDESAIVALENALFQLES